MHFCICVFIALICLVTAVLFTEVFPKWFKANLAILGSFTAGWATSILIRKIAELTGAYSKPELMPVGLIAAAIILVLVVIVTMVLNKKKAK